MNRIDQTVVFKQLTSIAAYKDIMKNIASTDVKKYVVPEDYFDYMLGMFRNYRFYGNKHVVTSLKNKEVVPVIFQEVVEVVAKPVMPQIPVYFYNILMKYNEKVTNITDISMKSSYTRNSEKTATGLKVEPRIFFGYVRSGVINRKFKTSGIDYVKSAPLFARAMADMYSNLLYRILDVKYGLCATSADSSILKFLCALFYFEALGTMSKDDAITKALSIKTLTPAKNVIANRCNYYINDSMPNIGCGPDEQGIYAIQRLIDIIEDQFPTARGRLNIKTVFTIWMDRYGTNAILALEDFSSFLSMVVTIDTQCDIYKDIYIESLIRHNLIDVNKAIQEILG